MNLIIFGPPGSGKGTYTARLAESLKIGAIATGDIFRNEVKRSTELGKRVFPFVNKGELVPDEVTIGVLKKRISQLHRKKGFILDGYPRTIGQAKALDKIARIDSVIRLIVPEWVIIERLSNRRVCRNCGAIYNVKYLKSKVEGVCDKCGGELYQREDDKPEVIRQRLKVYEKQTQPLIEYYRNKARILNIECNAPDVPPERIVKKILEEMQKARLLR